MGYLYRPKLKSGTRSEIWWAKYYVNGRPVRESTGVAGVPGRIPHDFRRTAVRNLERAGVPRSVAMKMVGHKTEAVYRRYAIVSESDLHEAARKLAALPAGTFSGTSSAAVE
jgi:integrase